MNSKQAFIELQGVFGLLYESGIAVSCNPTASYEKDNYKWVSWDGSKSYKPFNHVGDGYVSFSEYLSVLESKQYSIFLFDGSIIQLSYKFNIRGIELAGARFTYIPYPLRGLPSTGDENGIVNPSDTAENMRYLFNLESEKGHSINEGENEHINFFEYLSFKTPLRFEYDPHPDRSSANHPVNHIHMSHEESRIHVDTSLSAIQFIKFICQTFYNDKYIANDKLCGFNYGQITEQTHLPGSLAFKQH